MGKSHHIHHDFHEDFHLRESLDEEEHEEKKKGFWVIMMSIFLILLSLTFILPLERIGSIVESKKINSNYVIELDNDYKIFFLQNMYEKVRDTYLNSSTEMKMCLLGEKQGKTFVINDYYMPRIISSKYDSVTSEICDGKTLISLHSHPGEWCIFSAQDIKSYEQLKERNNQSFIGLICGVDSFNFHGYKE
jgi:proteasome lid subunit RPN8/RPN11